MTTEKLYLNDPLLLEFEARLVATTRLAGAASLLLDRSSFYGEAGGQLGDRGILTIGERAYTVTDTQYDTEGRLHHLVAGDPDGLREGVVVQGAVDFDHRRDMMSQHTGQHLLSATFYKVCEAETVSARLGATSSTIDLDHSDLSCSQVEQAVNLANSLVLADLPVRAHYPNENELAELPLRRSPKVKKDIRLIEIGAFDLTPCGGTHCLRSGQIGPLHVTGRERVKQMTRIHFIAGQRAIDHHRQQADTLLELGETLGCGAAGVGEGIAGLRRDLVERNRELSEARAGLMAYRRAELFAAYPPQPGGTTLIRVVSEKESLSSLRTLAAGLTQRADVVALVAGRDEKSGDWRLILTCGDDADFNAGAWFKERGRALGGRGGGRPNRAEGSLPAAVDPHTIDPLNPE